VSFDRSHVATPTGACSFAFYILFYIEFFDLCLCVRFSPSTGGQRQDIFLLFLVKILITGMQNTRTGTFSIFKILPPMKITPRRNKKLVFGAGNTDQLGYGLPHENKNNPHSVPYPKNLCLSLYTYVLMLFLLFQIIHSYILCPLALVLSKSMEFFYLFKNLQKTVYPQIRNGTGMAMNYFTVHGQR
jgi:hypothetical protein